MKTQEAVTFITIWKFQPQSWKGINVCTTDVGKRKLLMQQFKYTVQLNQLLQINILQRTRSLEGPLLGEKGRFLLRMERHWPRGLTPSEWPRPLGFWNTLGISTQMAAAESKNLQGIGLCLPTKGGPGLKALGLRHRRLCQGQGGDSSCTHREMAVLEVQLNRLLCVLVGQDF